MKGFRANRGTNATASSDVDAGERSTFGRRFPHIVLRRDVDPAALRELMEVSGYLALRDDTEPTQDWFQADVPEAVSRDAVYVTRDGRPLGHLSSTRVYSHTWLSHQLATLSGDLETHACRLELYRHACAVPGAFAGDLGMMIGYFDWQKRWHRHFCVEFSRWVSDERDAVLASFDRFERASTSFAAPTLPGGVEVADATADELVVASALVRSQIPKLLADAMDIAPATLVTSCFHPTFESSNTRRERRVLALRQRGRLAGVALCETGPRSLSLFNILNCAQIYLVPAAATTDAQLALLGRARELYRARGVTSPLVVSPPNTLMAANEPGTSLAETMGCIAISAAGLRQWAEFIEVSFGSRAAQVRRGRGERHARLAR